MYLDVSKSASIQIGGGARAAEIYSILLQSHRQLDYCNSWSRKPLSQLLINFKRYHQYTLATQDILQTSSSLGTYSYLSIRINPCTVVSRYDDTARMREISPYKSRLSI